MGTLAEQFAESKGAAIHVDGRKVFNMYRRPVSAGQTVTVRARPAMHSPVQGLRIKLAEGVIAIKDQRLKEVVVWLDTAPLDFEFSCRPTKQSTELRVWNCWRDPNGVMQAWIGNAGMIAEETGPDVLLRCSTGVADFEPGQLSVELKFLGG